MTKTLSLTVPNIVSALKRAGFVTKNDLDGRLNSLRKQIDDDQFEARTEFYAKMIKPDLNRLGKKIDKVNDSFSLQISGIKDDIEGLSAEFSTSPSREEFEKLSRSVFPQ